MQIWLPDYFLVSRFPPHVLKEDDNTDLSLREFGRVHEL